MKSPERILLAACLSLASLSYEAGPLQAEDLEGSSSPNAGFQAVITGAYEGEVSGAGVLKFLPDAGFERQGYFILSDGQGIRPYGVTFVLPRGSTPGRYALESPSAFDVGTVPSVRVDRDMGDSVLSSEKNTSGVLDLIAFPEDEKSLGGSDVRGRFEFETEDPKGRRVGVTGSFDFPVE